MKVKVGLKVKTREILGEKVFELANIAAGVMVFAQLMTQEAFALKRLTGGFLTTATFYLIGFWILERRVR